MKRIIIVYSLLLFIFQLIGNMPSVYAQPETVIEYVPNSLIVAFYDQNTIAINKEGEIYFSPWDNLRNVITDKNIVAIIPLFSEKSPLKNVYIFNYESGVNLENKMEDISIIPQVKSVFKRPLCKVDFIPNDYYFTTDSNLSGQLDRWTLYEMQINRAWDIVKGDSSIIVGVIDTGLDFEHPDLDANVWINPEEDINHNGIFDNYPVAQGGDIDTVDNDNNNYIDDVVGWDWYQGDNIPHHDTTMVGSHGSIVGSIISSKTNNSYGIAGITCNSKIMALKIGDGSDIDPYLSIAAINYAIEKGVDIINMSFSFIGDYGALHDLIKIGDSLGVIFVGSAGDYNNIYPRYPGSYEEVIRVAVVDSSEHKTTGSCYSDDIFISAPAAPTGSAGYGIVICAYGSWDSLYPGDQPPHHFVYSEIATSGGAAEISGVCALLKSAYPEASNEFIKEELIRGADDIADDEVLRSKLGAGRANAYRSLTQWGTISENTTWSNKVYISGDLRIASSETLTIDPGTIIHVAMDDNEKTGVDTAITEIWVDGYLQVNGTEANPVEFIAWNGDEFTEVESDSAWFGIFVRDSTNSGAEFNHCIIKNAIRGIQSNTDITLRDCRIENCQYLGVSIAYADSVNIMNTVIRDIGYTGLNVLGGTAVEFRNSKIFDVDGTGAKIYSGATLWADSSQFIGNDTGIYVLLADSSHAKAIIDSCVVKENDTGIWSHQTNDVLVSYCLIKENTTNGIYCSYSNAQVRASNINYNDGNGIYCYCAHPTIWKGAYESPNIINYNSIGIKSDYYSQPIIERTKIRYNGIGVAALNYSIPDLGDTLNGEGESEGYNIITNSTSHHVSSLSDNDTIRAENNYWGTGKGGAVPSKFLGYVDWHPYLTSPPSLVSTLNDVTVQRDDQIPKIYSLSSNYPNPFNPITHIDYQIPNPGCFIQIVIYNVKGQRIKTLVKEQAKPGRYSIEWQGTDDGGQEVASGIYFVQMRASNFRSTKKLVLLK